MIAFTKDRKNFEIFSNSFMTACWLFMLSFCLPLCFEIYFFLYVSLLYPLPCMPIFPSFFIRVYLIITFPFLFQSTCRLPAFNMSLMVIKTPALLFLKEFGDYSRHAHLNIFSKASVYRTGPNQISGFQHVSV